MTKHIDFSRLSVKQRDALLVVELGEYDHQIHPGTAESLIRLGLIEAYDDTIDGLLVTCYKMPMRVHVAWCEWCSEQVDSKR